jgi:hypothetical protein
VNQFRKRASIDSDNDEKVRSNLRPLRVLLKRTAFLGPGLIGVLLGKPGCGKSSS